MEKLENVENILPLISVVGRLNYKNAKTDILVHAVPKEYFKIARQDIIGGLFYQTPDYVLTQISEVKQVAGAETQIKKVHFGDRVRKQAITVSLLPHEEIPVYLECKTSSTILGFATRGSGTIRGFEIYGGEYTPFEVNASAVDTDLKIFLGTWVTAEYPILPSVEQSNIPGFEDRQDVEWKTGCVPMKYLQVVEDLQVEKGAVLGESSSSALFSCEWSFSIRQSCWKCY